MPGRLKQPKKKRIIGHKYRPSRIVVRPRNPLNRYKLRSTLPAPGGVGALHLVIHSR